MELTTSIKNNILIIALNGRLDATNAEDTKQKISQEIDKGYNQLILDLQKMEYLSSAGIRVLITTSKKIQSLNGEIKMASLQEYPLNVLKISGFLSIFKIYDTLDNAEKDFSSKNHESDTMKRSETFSGENVNFRLNDSNVENTMVKLIGDYHTFLISGCDEENLYSQKISDIKYSLGIGALGQNINESLDHLGEIMFVNGTAIWVEPDGKNIPDFLKSANDEGDIKIHTPYQVVLDTKFNDIVRFEAKNMSKGVTLKDLYSDLFVLAKERNNQFKGLISCVIRADVGGIFGATLKKSPKLANKPETSENILEKENIRQWLQYNLDASYENSSIIIVGLAMTADVKFDTQIMQKIFNIDENQGALHNHGAIFKFIPEDRDTFDLEKEVDKVITNSELIGMQHLLENTTLKKGIIGVNYIEEIQS